MANVIILNSDNDDVASALQSYFQSGHINFLIGSGASRPAIAVAGTIEAEINDLLANGKPAEAGLKSLEFIEGIEAICEQIPLYELIGGDLESAFTNYRRFLSAVDKLLFERKSNMLERQANIFTSNYDTFIEAAAAEIPSLILNDGFDRSSGLGTNFVFAPELYFDRTYRSGTIFNRPTEVPTINLLKIHGSLTWHGATNGIRFCSSYLKKLTEDEKKKTEKVDEALQKRAIILPNSGKFYSTVLDRIYYDLLRMYSNALERENALLIAFGFSFADEHILDITRRALRNPTAQLIVFAYDEKAAADFQDRFEQHRNVCIIAPKAEAVIGFEAFNSLLESIPPVAQ